MKIISKLIVATSLVALALTGCGKSGGKAGEPVKKLTGAGASFPYPLYSKMFKEYNKINGIQVNYQSIGSGGGQKQIKKQAVDFGASDAFLTDKKLAKYEGKLLHIPTCLGAVAVTFNLPGIQTLNLTPEVLADIFMRKITKWNDPAIVAINSGVELPDQEIKVMHRSDRSGTTAIFTDYLSKISEAWSQKYGKGPKKEVSWAAGAIGHKGNEGVAKGVMDNKGAIGYVELAYTIQNNLAVVALKNAAGNFVKPSLESASLAGNAEMPADTRVSITNTTAEQGYPIAGFTWLLVYQDQKYNKRSKLQGEAIKKLLWWMTHEGQKFTTELHYAPLPAGAQKKAEAIINSINYGGAELKNK